MSANATLEYQRLPNVGPGWRSVVVDCKHATTRAAFMVGPGGPPFDEDDAARVALAKHHAEESCRCIRKLWRRYFGAPLGEMVLVQGQA